LNFHDFDFEYDLLDGLDSMGFEKPTPIQQKAIPLILNNHDLIACAQTGTGKTAAFLLPIINKIIRDKTNTFSTLIIVPTRELAIQIDEAIQGLAYFTNVSSIAIYGGNDGMSYEQEKKALMQGADIIVATPGRFISHLNMGYIKFDTVQHLILDEADRMLDMGFSEDLNKIISRLPVKRQSLLFSATMPPKIRTLAKAILHHPEQINISVSKPAEGINQGAYIVHESQKMDLLKFILKDSEHKSILVFSGTKDKVKKLERELLQMKLNVAAIHSDLEQERRNEVLRLFKSRSIQTIVATDVLSRGIDIDSIGLVINYDVPHDTEDYIHRVGRTARAETTGTAITFVNTEEQGRFKKIEEFTEKVINKLPLPVSLGAGPEYNPTAYPKARGPKRSFKPKPKRKPKV
jgi:superfamily II DNA/RNA helicase